MADDARVLSVHNMFSAVGKSLPPAGTPMDDVERKKIVSLIESLLTYYYPAAQKEEVT